MRMEKLFNVDVAAENDVRRLDRVISTFKSIKDIFLLRIEYNSS